MTPVQIGYVGLSHLGIVSAAAAAAKGFSVLAYDPDPALVERLTRGDLPITEPGLLELWVAGHKLEVTSDPARLLACDLVYLSQDVPTEEDGSSDLSRVDALIERIEPVLAPEAVLVVLCQVPPGFTRALARRRTGRVFYQIETLIFGQAVSRALEPERFMVGCADPALPLAESHLRFLSAFGCPVLPMHYESAELAKIAINVALVASVSVTNTLAELCEHVGADWAEIEPALRLDRRIGPHAYLKPGLGIAGGNLERDLATVSRLGRKLGTDTGVIDAFLSNSRHRREWVAGLLRTGILDGQKDPLIGMLGLAYKAGTASIRNSPALHLLERLKRQPAGPWAVQVFDPAVVPESGWYPCLHAVGSPIDVCRNVDALIIMTPWAEFATLAPVDIAREMRGRIVIDPYGVLDPAACCAAGLKLYRLGAPLA